MPCLRPQVAPSHAALWITDDILTAAWRRFTHAYSNTANLKQHTDGGRRHGSNVPGPLEARRRLAKRRMGLSAHSHPPNGGGGDFGALFGFGTRGAVARDVESGWRWEAPKLQQERIAGEERPDNAWGYGWLYGASKREQEEAWEKFLAVPGNEADVDAALPEYCNIEKHDPVLASREAFDKLLADLDGVKQRQLEAIDVAHVIAFLQSTEDEVDAKNMSRLVAWFGGRGLVMSAIFDSVMELIKRKINLRTLSTDESAEIAQTLVFALQPTAPDHARLNDLMQALQQQGMLAEVCASTTRLLVERSTTNEKLAPTAEMWLRCIRSLDMDGGPATSVAWQGVYEQLSQKYPRPALLCEHLSTLEDDELATVLLRYWVPRMSDHPLGSGFDVIGDCHTKPGAVDAAYRLKVGRALRLYYSRRPSMSKTRLSGHWRPCLPRSRLDDRSSRPLIDLLCMLDFHRYPFTHLASEIFTILCCSSSHATNKKIFSVYIDLRRILDFDTPDAVGVQLVDHFLSTGALGFALYVFRGVSDLPLSRFHALATAIAADTSSVHSSKIWDVLNRNTSHDRIPRPALGAAKQPLVLRPSHIDLVHQVAFAFAQQENLRPRVALRRVWECYRFLNDRAAPVGSLISRAFVAAGVTRPMKMGMRVPTQQLRYILSIVDTIEGREVAEQLDRMVLEISTKEVLPGLLKKTRMAMEEREKDEGSERWRSVAWARQRHGVNKVEWARNYDAERDVSKANEIFASNDDINGDVSWSSSRAEADPVGTPALEAKPVGLPYSQRMPGGFEITEPLQKSPPLGDVTSAGATTELSSPRKECPEKRGLGYDGFRSSGTYEPFAFHDINVVNNENVLRCLPRAGVDLKDVPTLEAEPVGIAYSSAATFGESQAARPLQQALSEGNAISKGAEARQSIGEKPEELNNAHDLCGDFVADIDEHLSVTNQGQTESPLSENADSESSMSVLGEPHAVKAASQPPSPTAAVARKMDNSPNAERESVAPLSPVVPLRNKDVPHDHLQLATAPSERSLNISPVPSPSSSGDAYRPPVPILWEGKPYRIHEAAAVIRRFKKEHSERLPTVAEAELMQTYEESLDRVFDGSLPMDMWQVPVFPFKWGNFTVHHRSGRFLKKHVVTRAKAAGRELDEKERIFVQMVTRSLSHRLRTKRRSKKEMETAAEDIAAEHDGDDTQ